MKSTLRRALATVWLAALALAAPASAQPTEPAPRDAPGWKARHAELVKQAPAAGGAVVFLGDSITEGWRHAGAAVWKERLAGLGAANFGIGGDCTQHVLWRLRDGEIDPAHAPRAVVLLIGVNNARSDAAPAIVSGVAAVLAEVEARAPAAKVLLLGIFPCRELPGDPMREKVRAVNAGIAKLADGGRVRFLDFGQRLVEPDGTISRATMPDFLHLTEKGYAIWADAIAGPLAEMLRAP